MLYNAGLVLEGGGLRGIFTAGVLDCFLEHQLEFDTVIGVSAGACHACSYLSRQKGRAKATAVDYVKDPRYCTLYSLVSTGDLFSREFVYDRIPRALNPFDYQTFRENPSRLLCCVTNVETGRAEFLEARDLWTDMDLVRASASLPLVSHVVEIGGKGYLDGGIADSIPVGELVRRGFGRRVAVLTQPAGYQKELTGLFPLIRKKYRQYPNLVGAMAQRHVVYNRETAELLALEQAGEAFVLRPETPLQVGRLEKDREKLEAAYQAGYACAGRQLPALLAYLEK